MAGAAGEFELDLIFGKGTDSMGGAGAFFTRFRNGHIPDRNLPDSDWMIPILGLVAGD